MANGFDAVRLVSEIATMAEHQPPTATTDELPPPAGLIVIVPQSDGPDPAILFEELLGAPLLARAIAAAIPLDRATTGVLVVPERFVELAREEIVERYALDEIDHVVAGGPDVAACVQAGLDKLNDGPEHIIVQHGAQILVRLGHVDTLIDAADEKSAAVASGVRPRGAFAQAADDGVVKSVPGSAELIQLTGPLVVTRQTLTTLAADASGDDIFSWFDGEQHTLHVVEDSRDNVRIDEPADLGRALEVFSRRAADYPFVVPKDALPDDPVTDWVDKLGEGNMSKLTLKPEPSESAPSQPTPTAPTTSGPSDGLDDDTTLRAEANVTQSDNDAAQIQSADATGTVASLVTDEGGLIDVDPSEEIPVDDLDMDSDEEDSTPVLVIPDDDDDDDDDAGSNPMMAQSKSTDGASAEGQ